MVSPEHAPLGLNQAVDELVQALELLQPDSHAEVQAALARAIVLERRNARLGGPHACDALECERVWSALDDVLAAVDTRAVRAR